MDCACEDGRRGVQQCLPHRSFGVCTCTDAAPPVDLGIEDTPDVPDVPDVPDASDVPIDRSTDPVDVPSVPDVVHTIDVPAADVITTTDRPDARDIVDVFATLDAGVRVDVPTDQPRPVDAPAGSPQHPCAAEAIIDLQRVGEREGPATLYVGDNTFTLPDAMEAPAWCADRASRTVVFRYVAHTSARVSVSVEPLVWLPAMSTSERLNPVAWALDRCEEGRAPLVCVDDGRITDERAVFALPTRVEPGAAIYLAVAGRGASLGRFLLRVVEHPGEQAPGALCDPNLRRDVCAVGSSCEGQGYVQEESRCVPDGARFGRCRIVGAPCDRDLACDGRPGHVASRCVPTTMSACSVATARLWTCPQGTCVLGASGPECAVDGAWMGRCREGSTPCAAGLICSESAGARNARCVNAQPEGAHCAMSPLGACADGTACVAPLGSMVGRCLRVGARGGRCRVRGEACDAGLACNRRPDNPQAVCVPAAALGEACRVDGTVPCAPGAVCLGLSSSDQRCVLPGSAGARCRTTWPRCDAGLACNGESSDAPRCVPVRALGQTCDLRSLNDACPEGSLCLGTSVTGVCTAAGANGQRCRVDSNRCDAGLRCVGSPPTCRRVALAGALCGPSADSATCPPGHDCQSFDTESRCTPLGTAGRICHEHGPACAVGLACSTNGSCAVPAADGAACSGAVPCGPESTCVRSLCRRRGSAGGSCRADVFDVAPCDAGSVCDMVQTCQPSRALGEPCSTTLYCDHLEGCSVFVRGDSAAVCVAPGVRLGRCREVGPPCDAGLVCDRSVRRCLPTLTTGTNCFVSNPSGACEDTATCRGSPLRCVARGGLNASCRPAPGPSCDAGLACVGTVCVASPSTCTSSTACAEGRVCTAGRCEVGAYRVEVIAGAAPIDACAAGPSHLFTMNHLYDPATLPLPFPLPSHAGPLNALRMLPLTLDATLGVVLTDGSGNDAMRVLAGIPLDRLRLEMRCAAVQGAAPRRRLVLQWRGWTAAVSGTSNFADTPALPLETFDVAVVLGEDGTHEIRYLRLPPPPPLFNFWPTQQPVLNVAGQVLRGPPLRVTAPTTVRFLPNP